MILGLVILLYKIKYLNIAQFYISRFYLVVNDVKSLVLLIAIVDITFAYSYKIIYSIQVTHEAYGWGIMFKSLEYFHEDTWSSVWTLWKENNFATNAQAKQFEIEFVLLILLTIVAIGTNVLLIYFLFAAIIESYNKVSQNLKNQKYLARAKILFENQLLFKRDQVFADTRYVIKAQAEKVDEGARKSAWDDVTTAITSNVKTTVDQEGKKTENNFKFIKNKIVKLGSSQESLTSTSEQTQIELKSKFAYLPNTLLIESLDLMLRYLTDISGKSAGSGGGSMMAMAPAQSAAAKKKDEPKKGKQVYDE